MSYTSIIHVGRDGKAHRAGTLSNSWLWCPATWDLLSLKYRGWPLVLFENADRWALWNLHKTDQLTLADNVALQMTFDNVLVKREDFERVADLLEQCHADNVEQLGDMDWHILAVAKALRDASTDEDVTALGLVGTSVSGGPFLGVHVPRTIVREADGSEQEFDETERPYDVNVDRDHWFLDLSTISAREGQPPDPNPLPMGWRWADMRKAKVFDPEGRTLEMLWNGVVTGDASGLPAVLKALHHRHARGGT